MEEQNLIESFDESFYSDNLSDLGVDIGDTCIDLISTNEVVDQIPVLGLLKGVYKTYKSISTARLIKKIAKFLFLTADVSVEDKRAFVNELSEEIQDRGSEFLFDLINRIDNINKVQILANISRSKMEEKINTTEFVLLSKIIENIPANLFRVLNLYIEERNVPGESDMLFCSGLVYSSAINASYPNKYKLNRNGYLMLKYGLGVDVEIPQEYTVENSAYAVLK